MGGALWLRNQSVPVSVQDMIDTLSVMLSVSDIFLRAKWFKQKVTVLTNTVEPRFNGLIGWWDHSFKPIVR